MNQHQAVRNNYFFVLFWPLPPVFQQLNLIIIHHISSVNVNRIKVVNANILIFIKDTYLNFLSLTSIFKLTIISCD